MPGDLLLERPGPASGTKHVSSGRRRGAGAKRPENVPEMLRHTTGLPQGEYHRTVRRDGRISIRGIVYGIGKEFAGLSVHVITGADTCAFWDARTGELIAEHPIPEPGTTHVGFVRYNRRTPTFEPDPEPSPMSQT